MSDNFVPTIIDSNEGSLHFQEYLVKRRAEPVVKGIRLRAQNARFRLPVSSKPFAMPTASLSAPAIR